MLLSTKGKKQVKRRVSHWVMAKDPSISVPHLTMSNSNCLRKGKTEQARGDPLAPECFLSLCQHVVLHVQKSIQGYFFHESL